MCNHTDGNENQKHKYHVYASLPWGRAGDRRGFPWGGGGRRELCSWGRRMAAVLFPPVTEVKVWHQVCTITWMKKNGCPVMPL